MRIGIGRFLFFVWLVSSFFLVAPFIIFCCVCRLCFFLSLLLGGGLLLSFFFLPSVVAWKADARLPCFFCFWWCSLLPAAHLERHASCGFVPCPGWQVSCRTHCRARCRRGLSPPIGWNASTGILPYGHPGSRSWNARVAFFSWVWPTTPAVDGTPRHWQGDHRRPNVVGRQYGARRRKSHVDSPGGEARVGPGEAGARRCDEDVARQG